MENPATKLRIELEESAKQIREAFEKLTKAYEGIKVIYGKIVKIEEAINGERAKENPNKTG